MRPAARCLAVAFAVSGFASASIAADADAGPEALLLEIRTKERLLLESVTAYRTAEDLLLPVEPLARSLGFRLNREGRQLRGFGFSPRDVIDADFRSGMATRAGKSIPLRAADAIEIEGELYVSREAIRRLFAVATVFDSENMSVVVSSERPLPSEAAERLRNASVDTFADEPDDRPLRRVRSPYRFAGLPSAEVRLVSSLSEDSPSGDGSAKLSVNASGDLAWMTANYRAIWGSESRPDGVLLSLTRPGVTVGDVSLGGFPFTSQRRSAVGVVASSRRMSAGSGTLEGNAPPGSEVDLYAADGLVGVAIAGEDGAYRFENLRLQRGANRFSLAVVPEQGPIRFESRVVYSDSGHRASGWSFSLGRFGRSLLGMSPSNSDGVAGGFLAGAEFEQRIPPSQTVKGFASADNDGSSSTARIGIGTRRWVGRDLWQATSSIGTGGALTSTLGLSRRVGVGAMTLEHVIAPGGISVSEWGGIDDRVTAATRFRWDGLLGSRPSRFSCGIWFERREGAAASYVAGGQLSGRVGSMLLNAMATYRRERSGSLAGFVQAVRQMGPDTVRLGMDFDEQRLFKSATLDYGHLFGSDYFVRMSARKTETGSPAFSLAAYRLFGPVGLGLNGTFKDGRGKIELALTTGLDFASGMRAPGAGYSRSGSLSVLVYLDRNANGVFDAGDQPLPDIQLLANGGVTPRRTNRQGKVDMAIPAGAPCIVTVDESSLEDPSLVASTAGASVELRPGAKARVEIPVIATFELEGVVAGQPAAGVVVTLSAKGQPDRTTSLSSDGRFVFSRLVKGTYNATVTRAGVELARSEIVVDSDRAVEISVRQPS